MAGWEDYADWTSAETLKLAPLDKVVKALALATNERTNALFGNSEIPPMLYRYLNLDPHPLAQTNTLFKIRFVVRHMIDFPLWLDTAHEKGLDFEGLPFENYATVWHSAGWGPRLLKKERIEELLREPLLDIGVYNFITAEYAFQLYQILNMMTASHRIFGAFPNYNVISTRHSHRGWERNWDDCLTELREKDPVITNNVIGDGGSVYVYSGDSYNVSIDHFASTTYTGWNTSKNHKLTLWWPYGPYDGAEYPNPDNAVSGTYHKVKEFGPNKLATHTISAPDPIPLERNTPPPPDWGYKYGTRYMGMSNAIMEWDVQGGFEFTKPKEEE